jgi:F0F1-type ATP synthase assembly protein I
VSVPVAGTVKVAGEGNSPTLTLEPEDIRLSEMKGDLLRVLEEQAAGIEAQDQKAQHLISLALAGLGGAVAIGGFLADRIQTSSLFVLILLLVLLVGGALSNLAAMACFMHAYVGLMEARRRAYIPEPTWTLEKVIQIGFTVDDYHRSIIKGAEVAFLKNTEISQRLIRVRTYGVWILFSALTAYILTAIVYVFLATGGLPHE